MHGTFDTNSTSTFLTPNSNHLAFLYDALPHGCCIIRKNLPLTFVIMTKLKRHSDVSRCEYMFICLDKVQKCPAQSI